MPFVWSGNAAERSIENAERFLGADVIDPATDQLNVCADGAFKSVQTYDQE
jgi:hypothetical protein